MTEKLHLLTEAQLAKEYRDDVKEYNRIVRENEKKFGQSYMPTMLKKWKGALKDAKVYWDKISDLNTHEFTELIRWLTTEEEPLNPSGVGRPNNAMQVARKIRYAMSANQRAVAYTIVKRRYLLIFGEEIY